MPGTVDRRMCACDVRRQLASSAAIILSRPSRKSLPSELHPRRDLRRRRRRDRLRELALHLGGGLVALARASTRGPCATIGSIADELLPFVAVDRAPVGFVRERLGDRRHRAAHDRRDQLGLALGGAVHAMADEQLPQHDRRARRYRSAARGLPRTCSGAKYASLPLNVPSRVTCAAIVAFATPKSSRRASRRPRSSRSAATRRDARCRAARPSRRRSSCAACRPASTCARDRSTAMRTGIFLSASCAVRSSMCSGTPCTYS